MTAASVVGEAMPCGGDGAAEPFGDAVPGVATDASVDDGVGETSLGLRDEGDQHGDGGTGVAEVTAADQDQAGEGVVEDGAAGHVGEGDEGVVRPPGNSPPSDRGM